MKSLKKKITIDTLAGMIKKGFDNTPTKQQFEVLESKVDGIDSRLEKVEKEVKEVKEKLTTFIGDYESEKLPMRVEYIENALNLPKK